MMTSNLERQRIIEFMAEYLKNKTYFSYKIIRVAYLNKYYREYNNFQIIEIKKDIRPHLNVVFANLGRNKLLIKYSKIVYIVNEEVLNFLNSQISSPVRELDNPKCRECLNAGDKQLICIRKKNELCYEKKFQLNYIKHKNKRFKK